MILGFPVGSAIKNPPAMQEMEETQVQSLDQEDPPEQEMATHSNILAWEIQWTEEPGGLQSSGSRRVRTRLRMHIHTQTRTMPICLKKEPSRDLHLLCGVFVCSLSGKKVGFLKMSSGTTSIRINWVDY